MKVLSTVDCGMHRYAFIVALAVERRDPSGDPMLLKPSVPFQPDIFAVWKWKRDGDRSHLEPAGNTTLPEIGSGRQTLLFNGESLRPFLLVYRRLSPVREKSSAVVRAQVLPPVEPLIERTTLGVNALAYTTEKIQPAPQEQKCSVNEIALTEQEQPYFPDKLSRRLSPLPPFLAQHLHAHRRSL